MPDKIQPLNKLRVIDKHRVAVHCIPLDAHFVFQAHTTTRPGRPAEFTCHLYDSATLSFSGFVPVATLNSRPSLRSNHGTSCESAESLDELVHNLDWPHLPSELAALRSLMSTRCSTSDGTLLGDLAFKCWTPEERAAARVRQVEFGEKVLSEQREALQRSFDALVDEAMAIAKTAVAAGLRPQLNVDFTSLIPKT